MYRLTIVLAVVCACFYTTTCLPAVGAPTFEIRAGNCSKALQKDRVFFDHVKLAAIPFVTRSHDSEWHGDETIYCILAASLKTSSKGSTAEVTEGGLKQHFTTISLKSSRGHGLEYNISIYANATRRP